MDVNSLTINKVFSNGGDVQYILPYFQREYAWEKDNWQTLLNDIIGIYENDDEIEPEHFLGAMVVIEDGTRSGTMPAFKLVDGQQRLTTIAILLRALVNYVDSDSNLYRKMKKLLVNPDEVDLLHFKIVPTDKNDDRSAYHSLIMDQSPTKSGSRILEAYDFFDKQLQARIRGGLEVERIFKVIIQNMHVVFINLNQRERPYEIFESLNAKGKPLTQPDLVRNFIAMRLPSSKQEEVFTNYWVKIEEILQENRRVSRIGELTAFLRHYLAYRAGSLPNKQHVYARFRDRVESVCDTVDDFVVEIHDLLRHALYYDKLIRPEREENSEIRKRLIRLNLLEIFTAYPFLLSVYDAYDSGMIDLDEFVQVLDSIENYMARRFLASEPTAYVNKMFPALCKEVDQSNLVQSLQNELLTKKYPTDNRIRQSLLTQPIYDKRRPQRLVLILDTINRLLSEGSGGFTMLDNDASIEHIMPQTMTEEWKAHIGSNWSEVHRESLHTIGNLTIVTQEWNSSLSNSPFNIKRDKLVKHALLLNSQYFSAESDRWNAHSIQSRSEYLTEHVITIWPSFGEPLKSVNVTGTKPSSLIVLGEAFEVNSWRDVAFQMSEVVSQLSENFDLIALELNAFFKREDEWNSSRQLSNGWWLNVNLSGNSVVSFCERLAAIVGLSDDDWEFINV